MTNTGDPVLSPAWTVSEAAHKLNCSRRTVYRLIDDGELKAFRLKREVRIPDAEMRRFMAPGMVEVSR